MYRRFDAVFDFSWFYAHFHCIYSVFFQKWFQTAIVLFNFSGKDLMVNYIVITPL